MQSLETEIKYQGRTLKQIKREGRVAIYQQNDPYGYEVIVVRIEKARTVFGKSYPDHETYPSSEEWGTYGWTYRLDEREKAEKRFTSLLPKWGENLAYAADEAHLEDSEGKDSGSPVHEGGNPAVA